MISPGGLDMDILDAMVQAAGCSWRNTKNEIPWSRHMAWLKSGKLDIATAASWTKERAEYAYFTKPYRKEYIAIYIRKADLNKYTKMSLDDIANSQFRIGIERGNIYGPVMDPLLKIMGDRVEHVKNNKQNLRKLENKRIDGYLGFVPFDTIEIKKQQKDNEVVLLPTSLISTGEVHFMLSKHANSEKVYDALNNGLEEIKSNGTFDQIIKRYSEEYGVYYW